MKLPTALSRRPLPALEIGLAPLTAELSPNPIESCLPNGGRRASRSDLGVVPDVCGEATPACCNADVRLEAWFRGEAERRLRLGVAISIGGKGPDMAGNNYEINYRSESSIDRRSSRYERAEDGGVATADGRDSLD